MLNPQGLQILNTKEAQVKEYFREKHSPHHFLSYASFKRLFEPDTRLHFRKENLNIIDMHLRYNQFVYEQMGPYKWGPIICLSAYRLIRFKRPYLMVPLVYFYAFDFYFKDFFVWKHRNDQIINIRKEFITKLSKPQYKLNRITLFKELKAQLDSSTEIPAKYLKYGEWTEFIYHSVSGGSEQSNIFQTRLFEVYFDITTLSLVSLFKKIGNGMVDFVYQFKEFRHAKDATQYSIDTAKLLTWNDIKESQKSTVTTQFERKVRRIIELMSLLKTGSLFYSGFAMENLTHFYKHYDLVEPQIYTIPGIAGDLTFYYLSILIPFMTHIITRRK